MKKHSQEVYSTLVSGFDAEVVFAEDGSTADVDLFEGGAPVWSTTVDLTPFLDEGETIYTEDLISDSAQAAVDVFEAERDTLGQGAEALTAEGNKMQKTSFYEAMDWEDWYMSFKGTVFSDQATELLESYLDTFAPNSDTNPNAELDKTYQELRELEYNMNKLYFERMKSDPGGQTVIVINAKKEGCYGVHGLEDWLERFSGHRLEPQALAYAKEYLDTQAKIENLEATTEDQWNTRNELRSAMESMKLELLQMHLDETLPEDGPEAAPGLMNDLYELADGVEFDEPLEPLSELPVQMSEDITEETAFGMPAARKKAEADEVTGNEPVEVAELGQDDGVQIAEVPIDEHPFNVSERIELSKEFEQVLWGGITKKIPKGTKGKIDDLYDRNGDFYLVRFDDGRLSKVPYEYLKRLSKGGK